MAPLPLPFLIGHMPFNLLIYQNTSLPLSSLIRANLDPVPSALKMEASCFSRTSVSTSFPHSVKSPEVYVLHTYGKRHLTLLLCMALILTVQCSLLKHCIMIHTFHQPFGNSVATSYDNFFHYFRYVSSPLN